MRFTQTSATFSHSYNAAFLKDLKSVRFSTQNGNPSSFRFLDAFLSKRPIPQVRDGRGGLLFLVIMLVASACIFLFALLLNGFDISWLLAFLLGALLCCRASVGVGPDPRKVDTSGVSYAAWVSVADVSASKASGA
ncbi:hypothetical protein FNY91_13030 [Corynebacterium guaraldiae]|nr:hypothetical protein FNY91_13030 [Corynebacterium guaraldiae]